MKKLLSVVLAVAMVVSLATTAVWAAITPTDGWFASFAGDTYTISSAEDLAAFMATANTFAGKTVVLNADIEVPADAGLTAMADFAGTFDGQGHSIKGLKVALFHKLSGGEVKNLSVIGSEIAATERAGILSNNMAGTVAITNCYIEGTLNSSNNNAGGFTGGGKGVCLRDGDTLFTFSVGDTGGGFGVGLGNGDGFIFTCFGGPDTALTGLFGNVDLRLVDGACGGALSDSFNVSGAVGDVGNIDVEQHKAQFFQFLSHVGFNGA